MEQKGKEVEEIGGCGMVKKRDAEGKDEEDKRHRTGERGREGEEENESQEIAGREGKIEMFIIRGD